MPKKQTPQESLTHLGNKTQYVFTYDKSLLETFENQFTERDYFIKFNCPEFTSLCPITGQPDFATIYISYIPDKKMLESKSLKLYLFSFRNHGGFFSFSMIFSFLAILEDLVELMQPRYLEVWGKFLPRGGISIDPYANYGIPKTKYQEMAEYRLLHHDLLLEKVDNR